MLGDYIKQLSQLVQLDSRSYTEEERRKLDDLVFSKVFEETEMFIKRNLSGDKLSDFEKKLSKAFATDNTEGTLELLVRYLMEIPDVKYKLDNHMAAVIAKAKISLWT